MNRKPTPKPDLPSIRLYASGIMTTPPPRSIGNPEAFKDTKRGKITGWSAHSRHRLRLYMLTHQPAVECREYGLTLTIPGPPPDVETMRRLWSTYCREVARMGLGMIWRLEIQKRGSPHWHCILHEPVGSRVSPEGNEGDTRDSAVLHRMGQSGWAAYMLWHETLKKMGPVVHQSAAGEPIQYAHRMQIPGADRHSAMLDKLDDQANAWAWRRYLQDHASKAKQEQVAQGFGRHWGVVGRALYVQHLPDTIRFRDHREWYRLLRWLQRLVTGTVRCDKAPFGRKVAPRRYRGYNGRSVWFSNPAVADRMAAYILNNPSPP